MYFSCQTDRQTEQTKGGGDHLHTVLDTALLRSAEQEGKGVTD